MTTTINVNRLCRHWRQQGYIIVRRMFSARRSAELACVCDKILKQWRLKNPETGHPGGSDAIVMRHLIHNDYSDNGGNSGRLRLLEAVADSRMLKVCRTALDQEPLFRATALFMNPLKGSQAGDWHRDSQIHWPDEEEERRMLATRSCLSATLQVHVALEPSSDVEIVPGSHLRWDNPQEYAIRRANGGKENRSNNMPGAVRLALNIGDVLVFHPCSLHRGRYHINKRRRTFMVTYTGTDWPRFDCYSDQPWFLNEGYLDGLSASGRAFFERFVTQYRDDWLQSTGP